MRRAGRGRPARSGWQTAFCLAAAFLLAELLCVLLLPPLLSLDPYASQAAGFWASPGGAFPLGTDEVGRDVLARLLTGGRVSLFVGFASALLSLLIGVPLGLLAGYYRGVWESVIMRSADVFLAFPGILLILCLVSLVGPSLWNLVLALGLLGWAPLARLVYGNTLSLRRQDYLLALKIMGAKRGILLENLLPNVAPPVLAQLPYRVARGILAESTLSFLGAGLRNPEASWGNMMLKANELITLTQRPWIWLPPGLCILFTILSLQLLGEGIRRRLNPREGAQA